MLAVGCGGDPLPAGQEPLTTGDEISARQYLADTSAVATELAGYLAVVEDLGPRPTPAGLRAATPRLVAAEDRLMPLVQRLTAGQLADRRLDRQRAAVAARLAEAQAAMARLRSAAAVGNQQGAASAAAVLATAIGGLPAEAARG